MKKNTWKILTCLVLALTLVLCLCACDSEQNDTPTVPTGAPAGEDGIPVVEDPFKDDETVDGDPVIKKYLLFLADAELSGMLEDNGEYPDYDTMTPGHRDHPEFYAATAQKAPTPVYLPVRILKDGEFEVRMIIQAPEAMPEEVADALDISGDVEMSIYGVIRGEYGEEDGLYEAQFESNDLMVIASFSGDGAEDFRKTVKKDAEEVMDLLTDGEFEDMDKDEQDMMLKLMKEKPISAELMGFSVEADIRFVVSADTEKLTLKLVEYETESEYIGHAITEYAENGYPSEKKELDSDGNVIGTTEYHPNGAIKLSDKQITDDWYDYDREYAQYDEQGICQQILRTRGDATVEELRLESDGSLNVLSFTEYSKDVFRYDPEGNYISQITYDFDHEGKFTYYRGSFFEKDENGQETSRSVYGDAASFFFETGGSGDAYYWNLTEEFYDANGEMTKYRYLLLDQDENLKFYGEMGADEVVAWFDAQGNPVAQGCVDLFQSVSQLAPANELTFSSYGVLIYYRAYDADGNITDTYVNENFEGFTENDIYHIMRFNEKGIIFYDLDAISGNMAIESLFYDDGTLKSQTTYSDWESKQIQDIHNYNEDGYPLNEEYYFEDGSCRQTTYEHKLTGGNMISTGMSYTIIGQDKTFDSKQVTCFKLDPTTGRYTVPLSIQWYDNADTLVMETLWEYTQTGTKQTYSLLINPAKVFVTVEIYETFTDGSTSRTVYEYDGTANLTGYRVIVTDSDYNRTEYVYDADGKLIDMIEY